MFQKTKDTWITYVIFSVMFVHLSDNVNAQNLNIGEHFSDENTTNYKYKTKISRALYNVTKNQINRKTLRIDFPSSEYNVSEMSRTYSHSSQTKHSTQSANLKNNSTISFCGVDDVYKSSIHSRVKRYMLEGTKWDKLISISIHTILLY